MVNHNKDLHNIPLSVSIFKYNAPPSPFELEQRQSRQLLNSEPIKKTEEAKKEPPLEEKPKENQAEWKPVVQYMDCQQQAPIQGGKPPYIDHYLNHAKQIENGDYKDFIDFTPRSPLTKTNSFPSRTDV